MSQTPVPVLCRYRVKPGKQQEFESLLTEHWRMLADVDLVTDEPARLMRAGDLAGNVAYIEMFSWASAEAVQTAHETPEVMRLWEPMGALCEDMEFWHIEPLGE